MSDPTLTLGLEGDIPLSVFGQEMRDWSSFVDALTFEIGSDAKIEWFIEELSSGSALATVRAESDDQESVEEIKRGYLIVARALEANRPIPYSPKLHKRALALVKPVRQNENIRAIRFQTAEDDVTIVARRAESRAVTAYVRAYGAVRGRVQTLSSRKGLKFTLYDSHFDKAVTCYLREDQEEFIEDKWNHHTLVEGMISRDPISGRPVAIRQISAVTRLPDASEGDYRDARGVVPLRLDSERPEITLRRLRDGW